MILKDARFAPVYLLEVRREHHLDVLTVEAELKPGVGDGTAARDLAHAIKAHTGVSAEVRLMALGTIARSAGKAKRVNDLRPKE
jgi:phenylacetate-CoA ligase